MRTAEKLSRLIHRLASGPVTLGALVVFLLFTGTVLPRQAALAEAATGLSESPDVSLTYSAARLYALAEAYGPAGRQAYIRARFTFDLLWPLIYLTFLATAISWLSRKALDPDSPWLLSNLVPVLATAFDLLENLATSLVMFRFPERTPVIAELAGVFTLFKWLLVGVSFVLLVFLLGAAVWRRLKAR